MVWSLGIRKLDGQRSRSPFSVGCILALSPGGLEFRCDPIADNISQSCSTAGREIELTLVMGATVFCALSAIFVAKLLYIRILVGIVSS